MNEQAKEALSALLTQVTELAQSGVAIAQEQVPEVLQQLIMRDRALYTLWALICVSVFIAFARCVKGGIKHGCFGEYAPTPWFYASLVSGGLALVAGISLCTGIISPLLTVWFAPKLYLIETLSKMLK